MHKFEKILKDNDISEDSIVLPESIKNQIKKLRRLEKTIIENPDDVTGNEEREGQINSVDSKIMETLPEHFELEDEAEEIAKEKKEKEKKAQEESDKINSQLKARAKKMNLSADATESEIVKAEKKAQSETEERSAQLKARAKKVNLPEDASEEKIAETERKLGEDSQKESALNDRAKAVNLPVGSTEAEIVKAEQKAKEETEELDKPAKTNGGALEKLFKKGKKTVTLNDLSSAGFDTGFFGPVGIHGCTAGDYRIFREDPNSRTFDLLKK